MIIAGYSSREGEEYVTFTVMKSALYYLQDLLQEGYAEEDLRLYKGEAIPFDVNLSPTITADGTTV